MTAPELKPCPFCGGEAEGRKGKTTDGSDWHYVECMTCEAMGPRIQYASHNIAIKEALAEAWNSRADLARPTIADALALPEVKALVDAASQLSRAVDSSFYPENRGGYETVEQMREVHAKEREVAIQTYVGARDAEEALAMSHRSALSVIRGGAKARINDMLTDLNTTLTAINNKV